MLIAVFAAAIGLVAAPAMPHDTARAPAESASRVVVGVVAGDAPFSDPLLAGVLDAAFAGSGQRPELRTIDAGGDLLDRMEWARASAAPDIRVVYWIEPLADGRHRLYLFDPRGDRTWVRSLPQGSEVGDVLDTLGAMVRSLTDGLPDGEPVGMQRVEVEPPAPIEPAPRPDPPVEQPPPRTRVAIAASYAGTNFDAKAPWQSGGAIDVDVELPVAAFVRIGAAVLAPARIDDPRVDVWRVPIAIEAGYRFRRDRRVRPEVGAGVDVDPIVWRARADEGRSGRSARVGLGPVVGVGVRLWRGFGLHVWARADVWAHNVTFVVQDAGTRRARRTPHPVAAFVRAGLHWVF